MIPVVHPAVRELSPPENIVILDGSEIDELKIVIFHDLLDLFFRHADLIDTHNKVSAGKERNCSSDFRRGQRACDRNSSRNSSQNLCGTDSSRHLA
jgi:hypothetical protein